MPPKQQNFIIIKSESAWALPRPVSFSGEMFLAAHAVLHYSTTPPGGAAPNLCWLSSVLCNLGGNFIIFALDVMWCDVSASCLSSFSCLQVGDPLSDRPEKHLKWVMNDASLVSRKQHWFKTLYRPAPRRISAYISGKGPSISWKRLFFLGENSVLGGKKLLMRELSLILKVYNAFGSSEASINRHLNRLRQMQMVF